ncbi:hypothetical protein Bbelb_030750 [Branchiostoma belcheri]|nr:hypothetical protein Bbelb_030750 [Branchiostoma belcheri]
MSAEKVFYGPIEPERPSRRERAASSRVFLAGVFGVVAVLTAAVVLAMVLNDISQQMARDHEEIMVLKASAQRDHEEIAILKASAERDHEEIADLKVTAEKSRLQNAFLMERVAVRVLESQLPASRDEHQMPDVSTESPSPACLNYRYGGVEPEGSWLALYSFVRPAKLPPTGSEQSLEAGDSAGDAVAANAKVPSNNGTFGVQNKRSRRSVTDWDELLAELSDLQEGLGDDNEFETRQAATKAGGAVYIRWGRKDCEGGARLLYEELDKAGAKCWASGVRRSLEECGFAGGSKGGSYGAGSFVCLPQEPQWGNYKDGVQSYSAKMYGGEYYLYNEVPFGSKALHYGNVPCAVCHAQGRGSKLMIPARNTCSRGWRKEYHGYLMASYYHTSYGGGQYVCVDEQIQGSFGGSANQAGALFYPVEASCGALLCPPYVNGRELTCVVCTK